MKYLKNTKKRKEAERLIEAAWAGLRAIRTLDKRFYDDLAMDYRPREVVEYHKPHEALFINSHSASVDLDCGKAILWDKGNLEIGCQTMSLPKAFRVLKAALKNTAFKKPVNLGGNIGNVTVRREGRYVEIDGGYSMSLSDARALKKFISANTRLK